MSTARHAQCGDLRRFLILAGPVWQTSAGTGISSTTIRPIVFAKHVVANMVFENAAFPTRKVQMLSDRILNDVKRLSEAERCELMRHLSSTPTSSPPPRPENIDDLLELLNDDKVEEVSDYLQRTGNPNVSLNLKMRPVFLARSAEMVDLLIEAGAEVNAIDEFGRTAAHLIAGYDGRLPALQRLVKAGANLSRIDSHFETPLDVAHREKALANAAWLESFGAEPGPLATYRRLHPLRRIVSATRPAGPMPSLAQPIHDRKALWRHLRELIRFWDPTVDWQLIDEAATAASLNSLAGIELPAACLEFHQSGIFGWISWKGGHKEYAVARCSWASGRSHWTTAGRRDHPHHARFQSGPGIAWKRDASSAMPIPLFGFYHVKTSRTSIGSRRTRIILGAASRNS